MEERGVGMGLNSVEGTPDTKAADTAVSLQQKGFVVTSVDAVMNWARTGSCLLYTSDAADDMLV